ncbi:MAG: hypothetical protein KJ689_06635 [Bacteroidetes bacterium]|nr:hypothetical protein [Bacteroidota bacterium]
MKKFLLLCLLISDFAFSQMPNIAEVWLNKSQPYIGTIGNEKEEIKIRVNISEQNRKNDQEYFVSGYSLVENNYSKFEGKLKITKYQDGQKRSTVFGEYEFAEEPKGKHSGILKGKFVYTFMWNKKTQQIEKQYIEFIGDWKSYDGTLAYKTNWKN